MAKTQEQITKADDKSIGFDYQIYYALLCALRMKPHEEIGVEVKDDVHIQKSDGTIDLIQVKHSIQTKSDGSIINLRPKDYDLWHTISNWIDSIRDKAAGRISLDDHEKFINKHNFILASNKTESAKSFVKLLQDYQKAKISVDELKKSIKELSSGKSEVDLYINKFLALDNTLFEKFINKIQFHLDKENVIENIKEEIIAKGNHSEDADEIFNLIFSEFKTKGYYLTKGRKPFLLTQGEFNKTVLIPCFSKYRKDKLPFSDIRKSQIPKGVLDYIFSQQLKDLDQDIDDIHEAAYHRQLYINNIKNWERNGRITSFDIDNLSRNAELKWKRIHRLEHRRTPSSISESKNISLDCYDKTLSIDLSLKEVLLDSTISNGCFLELSNIPSIGWSKDWKKKYKK